MSTLARQVQLAWEVYNSLFEAGTRMRGHGAVWSNEPLHVHVQDVCVERAATALPILLLRLETRSFDDCQLLLDLSAEQWSSGRRRVVRKVWNNVCLARRLSPLCIAAQTQSHVLCFRPPIQLEGIRSLETNPRSSVDSLWMQWLMRAQVKYGGGERKTNCHSPVQASKELTQ